MPSMLTMLSMLNMYADSALYVSYADDADYGQVKAGSNYNTRFGQPWLTPDLLGSASRRLVN